jgi:arginine-tRNA-protein transferase
MIEARIQKRPRSTGFVNSAEYGRIPLDFLVKAEPHDCHYLPGREAAEEAFSSLEFSPELYHDFMNAGFRRAGLIFYRAACAGCRECRPIRVPVGEFKPSKSQRRVIRKNEDLDVRVAPPRLTQDKIRLWSDFKVSRRFSNDVGSSDELRDFLYQSPVCTMEFEYRLKGRLAAVGICDVCSRSISSVYTYYDPDLAARSLGTFSGLWEILYCSVRSIPYYYLGFFVADCRAMNYKERLRPCETLSHGGVWMTRGADDPALVGRSENRPETPVIHDKE